MKKKEHKVFISIGKYTPPEIEELRIRVEHGFAISKMDVGIGGDFGFENGIGDFKPDSGSGIGIGIGGDFGYE